MSPRHLTGAGNDCVFRGGVHALFQLGTELFLHPSAGFNSQARAAPPLNQGAAYIHLSITKLVFND